MLLPSLRSSGAQRQSIFGWVVVSLDDQHIGWEAAERLERGESPEPLWLQMAREQARRDREERERELRLRDETESVEAVEAHWQGVFRCDPYADVEYAPLSPDRRLHNVSGLNPAGAS